MTSLHGRFIASENNTMAKQTFTHTDKPYWPEDGYTKGDMLHYYERVAKYILPYLKDRPVALNRFPEGVTGIHFFQKNIEEKLPTFVTTTTLRAKTTGKGVRYALINNLDTLLYFANHGAIEFHPWNSHKGSLSKPDFLIFDLDPGEKAKFGDVVKVAQDLHKILESKKIKSFPKTSGKRGLHVYVPLDSRYSYKAVREFARTIAEEVVAKIPDLASLEHWPAKRKNKVYVDVLRNAVGQTAVAPYSLRPISGAPVSTPLAWGEVTQRLDPKKFTIRTVFKRLEQKGDPWRGVLGKGATIPGK